MSLIEARAGDAERDRLENFIAERYVASFGVRPPFFAPTLIGVAGRDGRLLAACGLRAAGDGFFSEQYVDGPIEQVAGELLGRAIERRRLFEINTMAAVSATGLRRAIMAAVEFGRRHRCRACLFTATAELRALLDRHGIVVRPLAPASPARLDAADAWGRYYEHAPWVCLADQPPWDVATPRSRMVGREESAVA